MDAEDVQVNKAEKTLLIQLIANVDDVVSSLSEEQKTRCSKGIRKIYCNYNNSLEGVSESSIKNGRGDV